MPILGCNHTIGKWENDLMTIIDLENKEPQKIDCESGMLVMYADQSAWLDKKLFPHVRFKYCPKCGKLLNFSAIKKRLAKYSYTDHQTMGIIFGNNGGANNDEL